jgi:hypothetical protein
MKNLNRIIVLVALLATSLSSCNTEDDVDVRFAVNAGVGGIYIEFQFGYRPGGYQGGYYYPNGYPSGWGQDFVFVGYVWGSPISNTTRPVLDQNGKILIGPNGMPVATNINPNIMNYLNNFSDSTLVPVLVTMRKDLSDNWDYVLRKKKNPKYLDISDKPNYEVFYLKEF